MSQTKVGSMLVCSHGIYFNGEECPHCRKENEEKTPHEREVERLLREIRDKKGLPLF